jgi:DNA sulfur modification protein DndD
MTKQASYSMIFKEFVIHNFGIYRGRHAVDLMPENGRPIVLFGALNGSGKTTFLDGLQLVLYGKQARCSGRGNMAYPDFLKSSINRYIPPSEGAALELEFCHHHEGNWQTVRVYRSWSVRGEHVKEKLVITRDGTPDSLLSERWAEYVEDFIPSQISELFFFDGEKIEALAEESSASAIIRTGVHALLGLDVVDRLGADLKVLQRRRRSDEMNADGKAKLDAKQVELDALTQEHRNQLRAAAEQANKVHQAALRVAEAKTKYRVEGGELAEEAGSIELELKKLREEKARHNARMVELASGAAPLLLVQDILFDAQKQAALEVDSKNALQVLAELKARDKRLVLSELERVGVPRSAIDKVASTLEDDRACRAKQAVHPVYLDLSPAQLAGYSAKSMQQLAADIKRELCYARDLNEQIDHRERALAGLPSIETLTPHVDAVKRAEENFQREQGALTFIEQRQAEVDRMIERVEREYQSLMTQEAHVVFKQETNARVLAHIAKVDKTLRAYREAILARNLDRLSKLILESFQKITRKKEMFTRVEINPLDYRLSLFDRKGFIVPSYQLSAGERQLLAISILWGLSRASGRLLPTIIDTPLGRLDGEHRSKLVKNYFPFASHQVILLSTDQEIDSTLQPQLNHAIAKEYLIEFNEDTMSSEVRNGYFDFAETLQ